MTDIGALINIGVTKGVRVPQMRSGGSENLDPIIFRQSGPY